jgi:hypothetical protein
VGAWCNLLGRHVTEGHQHSSDDSRLFLKFWNETAGLYRNSVGEIPQ